MDPVLGARIAVLTVAAWHVAVDGGRVIWDTVSGTVASMRRTAAADEGGDGGSQCCGEVRIGGEGSGCRREGVVDPSLVRRLSCFHVLRSLKPREL